MPAITPVKYTAPDGTTWSLRYTLGATRRIAADFGTNNLKTLLNQYDYACVPRLIYYCMFDEKGNPPNGMTVQQFEESFPGDAQIGIDALAALMSAMAQGSVEKKELEARMWAAINPTGSNSGPSEFSASASQTPSYGTSPTPNSTPSQSDGSPTNEC